VVNTEIDPIYFELCFVTFIHIRDYYYYLIHIYTAEAKMVQIIVIFHN